MNGLIFTAGAAVAFAVADGVLELRLENDGKVLRRAYCIDIRSACETAQQWRIDRDIDSRLRQVRDGPILCPTCGGEGFIENGAENGIQWFRWASCGDAWTLSDRSEMWRT